jgi:hypothetical protein
LFKSKFFSLLPIFVLSACGNSVSQADNTNQIKERSELSLSMIRNGCYGRCPIYDLSIQSDGKVLFEGRFWTEIKGKATDKITEEQFEQLISEIEKANFFSLKNNYNYDSNNCPTIATDFPSVKLHIKLDGKEKTINHYLGCWEEKREEKLQNNSNEIRVSDEDLSKLIFPQQLYKLENKIDEIVGTKEWIGDTK